MNCETTKRLAIYVIYDKEGIIDDYIPYYLNDLMCNLSHLVIVCNGKLNEEGRTKLERLTEDIIVRPNIGFDCGAVKHVLCEAFGWDRVYEYDELLICNDSVYGPLYPFKQVFDEMDERDDDFWGLVEQDELTEFSYMQGFSTSPRFLQSFFIVVRSKMLVSNEFRSFWEQLDSGNFTFLDAITQYEFKFTKSFTKAGFRYSTFVDYSRVYSSDPKNNYIVVQVDPYDFIARYNSPVIKRKSLSCSIDSALAVYGSENSNRIMSYIDNETRYNSALIWDNLLRTSDIMDIKNKLHLHYIIPTKARNSTISTHASKRVAVILHMYYPELVEECVKYIRNIPSYVDIFITTSQQKVRQLLEWHISVENPKVQIRMVENHGRDTAALLIDCHDILMQYEYLCFTHDIESSGGSNPRIGQSFMYLMWENTLASTFYIDNVLGTFDENSHLGFLATPQPYHYDCFSVFGDERLKNYDSLECLAKQLKLRLIPSNRNRPFTLGTAFWCRTAAMKALFEHKFNRSSFPEEPAPADGTIMHAIERIFPLVAQHEGYYSGVMMSDTYAAIRSVDTEYMLSGLVSRLRDKHVFKQYHQLLKAISEDRLMQFCASNSCIYIYGAGGEGNRVASFLEMKDIDYAGFIVSDGRVKREMLRNHPVKFLSEIIPEKDACGIILGLNRKNSNEVLSILNKSGFSYYHESL